MNALSADTLPEVPVKKLVVALVVIVMLVGIVAWIAKEPIAHLSAAILDRFGWFGVLGFVVLTDPIPGLGFQPALFVGWTGGMGAFPLFTAVFAGSMVGTALTWWMGRRFGRRLSGLLDRYGLSAILLRHRWKVVALAALLPLPYGVATTGAGAIGMSFAETMASGTVRALKIGIVLATIALGWGSR